MIRKFLASGTIHRKIPNQYLNSLKSTAFYKNQVLSTAKPIKYSYSKQAQSQLLVTHTNKYLYLINSLRDVSQFNFYRSQAENFLKTRQKFKTYKSLKFFINDMLVVYQIISWAQAYHHKTSQEFNTLYLKRIEELIQLSFSHNFSASHESIYQESSQFFETLRFSTYFQLVQNPSAQISHLYLNSYIHINRERNPHQFVKVYEALRQVQRGEAEFQIMSLTEMGLNEYITNEDFGKNNRKMNQIQMTIFLTYIKGRLSSMAAQQLTQVKQLILQYLGYQIKQNQSYMHLQNVCYCLFLSLCELSLKPQICNWLTKKLSAQQDGVIQYLTTFYAHQDKLTCLKVDIWIKVLDYNEEHEERDGKDPRLRNTATHVLQQLNALRFSTWRYKYIVWMLHNLCDINMMNLQLIDHLIEAITNHNLTQNRSLFSLTLVLKTLAEKLSLSQMANIDIKISKWLSKQSKQSLLSQGKQDLCQILHYADRHPALHPIYLPYLQKLLEASMGEFQWTALTELYYFGLMWKAERSEVGQQQMEYVRRYILNQYAQMGIKRRDIPQDSFFYKIHTLTTPEKFYRNHIQH